MNEENFKQLCDKALLLINGVSEEVFLYEDEKAFVGAWGDCDVAYDDNTEGGDEDIAFDGSDEDGMAIDEDMLASMTDEEIEEYFNKLYGEEENAENADGENADAADADAAFAE